MRAPASARSRRRSARKALRRPHSFSCPRAAPSLEVQRRRPPRSRDRRFLFLHPKPLSTSRTVCALLRVNEGVDHGADGVAVKHVQDRSDTERAVSVAKRIPSGTHCGQTRSPPDLPVLLPGAEWPLGFLKQRLALRRESRKQDRPALFPASRVPAAKSQSRSPRTTRFSSSQSAWASTPTTSGLPSIKAV